MRYLLILLATLAFAGCQQAPEETTEPASDAAVEETSGTSASDRLAAVLRAQPEEARGRYRYRNPQETIEFIGIEPGMVVVEALPGGGWYTKLLLPYLGSDGLLIGANYEMSMWPLFNFGTPEFVDEMSRWTTEWPTMAEDWRGEDGAGVRAFMLNEMPAELAGTADVVFAPRVMHNLARFENAGAGDFLTRALADFYAVLKPGGVLGIVQHEARPDMSDEFADGSSGYLKKAWLIEQVEAAGFEFVAESGINENAADVPTEDDVVWRLPPSLRGTLNDPELRESYEEIGESNRMTLKFVKPEG
ncbi:MAG: hypothetical protein QNI99_21155 [Woeseiaceae bacterium]|nr:hypothetical protein [Woeseiaceae bacterium]